MRANRIPVRIRLLNRIWNLEEKAFKTVPIGGGNPYHKCYFCGQSVPAISSYGHFSGCPVPGILKEIVHYRRLLEAAGG